jgi:DNA-binding CsgD family transcriptional regulator
VRTDPLPEIIERRERLTRRQNSPDEQQEAEQAFAIFAPADVHWLIAEVERLRTLLGENGLHTQQGPLPFRVGGLAPSPKERRALELLSQGLQVEEIAQRMMVSPFFVRVLLENARLKLHDDL